MHTHYHLQNSMVRKITIVFLLIIMATIEMVGIKVLAKNNNVQAVIMDAGLKSE